jgi:hypothetical protein
MAPITERQRCEGGEAPPAAADEAMRPTDRSEGNGALRVIASLVAAVPIAWSAIALLRLDPDAGLDAVPVTVAGLSFTPAVAFATLLIGLIAVAAAVSDDRASKLGIGALLACIGIAVLLAGTARTDFDLQAGHGWMALVVGLALVAAGLAMRVEPLARPAVRDRGLAH